MEKLLNLKPLKDLTTKLYEIIPTIIGALLFFIIAWILLKVILFVVRKSLHLTKINSLAAKLAESDSIFSSSLKINPTNIILAFVKWFLILVFLILGAELFGLAVISTEIGKLIGYLPKIFSALVILGFGLYLATIVKRSVESLIKSFDLNGSKLISAIVFYVIVIIAAITALNQADINTDVITENLSIILGALLAAFAIALGLGTREIVTRLILGFYVRKNFSIGETVKVGKFYGKIIAIDNICVSIAGPTETRVYPVKFISDRKILIMKTENQ